MNLLAPRTAWDLRKGDAGDDVRRQVLGLLAGLYPRNDQTERRHRNRYPFPRLVHLTPVTQGEVSLDEPAIVVAGRHLSEYGFGFYHKEPLPHRRVIASLQNARGHWLGFLLELHWCRFARGGWYESGGRFLRAIISPFEA